MGNRLFVGNLGDGVDAAALQQIFAAYGTVLGAQVMSDRITGQSKGFGFVQMGTDSEARAAIRAIHGKTRSGRVLTVTIAIAGEQRSRASGGSGAAQGGAAGHASGKHY